MKHFYRRGTEILKIENEFLLNLDEDFIYVSRGFVHALEIGLKPVLFQTQEWHHLFVKDDEYGFKAEKIYFE
ncbi:MAG: hypothetical protein WCX48_11025 [Bacteroidales bacterium]|jgi:hypothetical protein